jgi:uncharacterized Ntn-hydrolase superfamily protein
MTYTLLARCPRSGRFGLVTASYSICVGLHTDGAVRSNTGVSFTQGSFRDANNRLAMNLIAQGYSARQALKELLENDSYPDFRHIGVIDREGTVAVHAGGKIAGSCLHRIGDGYVVLGDRVASTKVIDAMAAAYDEMDALDLEERLLGALERGRDAGGIRGSKGRLPERSVALVVFGRRDFSDVDLRVDMHDAAVDELRRVYVDYKPHAAYYLQRALSPRNAIPSMEFADMLKTGETK